MNERGEVIEVAPKELPASFNRHIQSWDLAFEGRSTSDFVAGLDIRVSGAKCYIIATCLSERRKTGTMTAPATC